MAAIFDEVKLTWDGEQYTVTPTYRMIQQIEQHVSIAGISQRMAEGNPPMSHVAEVVAVLLRNAGAQVSSDEVYEAMLTDMDAAQISDIATIVMSAFVPRSKNSDSSDKSKASRRK